MNELRDNEAATFEQMFAYKMNERDEEQKETKKVAKDFCMA